MQWRGMRKSILTHWKIHGMVPKKCGGNYTFQVEQLWLQLSRPWNCFSVFSPLTRASYIPLISSQWISCKQQESPPTKGSVVRDSSACDISEVLSDFRANRSSTVRLPSDSGVSQPHVSQPKYLHFGSRDLGLGYIHTIQQLMISSLLRVILHNLLYTVRWFVFSSSS